MSDLQKIIVLCLVAAFGAVAAVWYENTLYDTTLRPTQVERPVSEPANQSGDQSKEENLQAPNSPVAGDSPTTTSQSADTATSTRVVCSEEMKSVEACAEMYAPVCGLVEVQCITAPCDPIPETFPNGCQACAQGNVVSYTEGSCSDDA